MNKPISFFSKKSTQYIILLFPLLAGIAFYHKTGKSSTPYKQDKTPLNSLIAQGREQYKNGDSEKAIKLYTDALKTEPEIISALTYYGIALAAQEKYAEAIPFFQTAVALDAQNPAILIQTGMCLSRTEKHLEAINYFKKAVALAPNSFDGHLQMSKALAALKKLDSALVQAQKAISIKPDDIVGHMHLGFIYNQQAKLDKAIGQYQKVLKQDPQFASALYNIGYSLKIAGKMKEAIPFLEKAAQIRPTHVDTHISLSHIYWSLDDFKNAWREYEWRWKLFPKDPRPLSVPAWDGKADLKNKKLLLYSEQGMGDTLQFIRFAKNIKQRGAHITCKIQKPLKTLLASYPYVDQFITEYPKDLTSFDYQAALLSMPGLLNTTPQTLPGTAPYLQADQKLANSWQKKVASDKNFKIGLCWHVDPIHEKHKSPLSTRSIPVELFAPLANPEKITFYSLQKINGTEQLKNLPTNFNLSLATFDPLFDEKNGRFMDTAALIANLDLVITADTSIAHLAAGMGKETWVLLPLSPDCRFSLGTNKMPWYPTMHLFRQTQAFDWKQPIQKIKTALQKKITTFEEKKKKTT